MALQDGLRAAADGVRRGGGGQRRRRGHGLGPRHDRKARRLAARRAGARRQGDLPVARTRRPDRLRAARAAARSADRVVGGRHPSAADRGLRAARCCGQEASRRTRLAAAAPPDGRGFVAGAGRRAAGGTASAGTFSLPAGSQYRRRPVAEHPPPDFAKGALGARTHGFDRSRCYRPAAGLAGRVLRTSRSIPRRRVRSHRGGRAGAGRTDAACCRTAHDAFRGGEALAAAGADGCRRGHGSGGGRRLDLRRAPRGGGVLPHGTNVERERDAERLAFRIEIGL